MTLTVEDKGLLIEPIKSEKGTFCKALVRGGSLFLNCNGKPPPEKGEYETVTLSVELRDTRNGQILLPQSLISVK